MFLFAQDTAQIIVDSAKVVVDTTKAVVPTPQSGSDLIMYLLAPVFGYVVSRFVRYTEKANAALANIAEPLKVAVVALLSFGVVKLQVLLGVTLPANPLAWSPEVVQTLLTALSALGIRKFVKPVAATPTK